MNLRLLERPLVASTLQYSGVLWGLESLPQEPCLIGLNYHRIGSTSGSTLDDGTFSATSDSLRQQMTYVKRRFATPPLDELIESIERGHFREPTVVVTFDDGYRDNYELAFPVLHSLGVPACFFVVSGYLDTPSLPWWDHIAHSVKSTKIDILELAYPERLSIDLRVTPKGSAIVRLLRAYKRARALDQQRFYAGLAVATGVDVDVKALAEGLFMSWDAAREMQRGGMWFGSHTVSHPVLSALTEDDQRRELVESRERIGQMLGGRPDALAYPVGRPDTFTETTKRLAQQAGYRAAFSYFGGRNQSGKTDRYSVGRNSVDLADAHSQFRLKLTLRAAAARQL